MTNNTDVQTVTSNSNSQAPKQYPCPHCQKQTPWQDNPFKPFCSKRCKMIDLGAWANEDYKIASMEDDLFSNDFE
ncbi:MAG: DNA gyrase inhibitor YacG [Pseudomonadales bacterium]|nr:MAG: DNA gyrase inhibitor YacG [Pseudomonadales bacterium]